MFWKEFGDVREAYRQIFCLRECSPLLVIYLGNCGASIADLEEEFIP